MVGDAGHVTRPRPEGTIISMLEMTDHWGL